MRENLSILVVEDNQADVDLMREMLPETGPIRFHIESVSRLSEALARLATGGIDLALIDLGLPDSQGLDTFLKLRQAAPDLAMIVLTGNDDQETAVAAVREGAQDYLVKGEVIGNLLVRAARYAIERKRAEESLQKERKRLYEVLETLPAMICLLTPDYHVIFANRSFREKFGESHGRHCYDYCFGRTEPCDFCETYTVLKTGKPHHWEVTEPDGDSILDVYDFPFTDVDGSPLILEMNIDITERKRAEHDLLASETRYRRLFESAKDGILILDAYTGKIVDVNPFLVELLGFDREYFLSKKLWEIGLFKDLAASEAAFIELQEKGYVRYEDLPLETKDGRRIEVEFVSNVYLVDSTKVVQCNIRDISEHNRAEKALRESENKFRAMVETIPLAIHLSVGIDQVSEYLNPEFIKLFGYTLEDVPTIEQWWPLAYPDEEYRREISAEWTRRIKRAIEMQSPIEPMEVIVTCKDGSTKNISWGYITLGDKNYACGLDLTERKRAEQERETLEEQYRQAQKMEAIGQLAGGVAHDFNNILQSMVGYSSMLLDRLPEHDETHEFAEEIALGADRAAALTRQLLTFSRRQILEMEDLDLNDVVNGLTKMIRRIIGEDVDVEVMEGRRLGIVHADRGQMEQVLLNLCINARDAMPEGGALTIETENVVMNGEYCAAHAWASPGQYVLLSVTDTGCGMDAETQARIFEPFFTTKELGKGTGLGLATVYGIVRQHQGVIQAYSEVGKGTTFKVYLSSFKRTASTVGTKIVGRARGGTETILVAEDDETLRKLAVRILENAGYTVLLAVDGKEALDVFEKHAAEINLCLLDVVMPKRGGKAVYDILRQRHPQLRFLFTSGYSANAIHTDFTLKDGIELIQKPYAPDALLRKVRQVLDDVGPISESDQRQEENPQ